jgi:hypothetical protein
MNEEDIQTTNHTVLDSQYTKGLHSAPFGRMQTGEIICKISDEDRLYFASYCSHSEHSANQ